MRRKTTYHHRKRIQKSLRAHPDRLHDQLVPLTSWIRTGGSTSLAIITITIIGRSGHAHVLVHAREVESVIERETGTRTNANAKAQVINTKVVETASAIETGTINIEARTRKETEREEITKTDVIEIDLYLATAGGDAFLTANLFFFIQTQQLTFLILCLVNPGVKQFGSRSAEK